MTREEKIAELINIRDNFNYTLAPREVFDDAIKALEQKDRYKKVLIKDHDAEPITYRGILDTEEDIVYMKDEPLERLKHYGFTIEEVQE